MVGSELVGSAQAGGGNVVVWGMLLAHFGQVNTIKHYLNAARPQFTHLLMATYCMIMQHAK